MQTIICNSHRSDECGLDHIVEPLASFICAAEHPSTALQTVLSSLLRQVKQTNQDARTRLAAISESRIVLPASS